MTEITSLEGARPRGARAAIVAKIVNHIGVNIPWSEMSARMISPEAEAALDEGSQIGAMNQMLFSGESGQALEGLMADLARAARDEGLTRAVENPQEYHLIDAWNRFQDGEDYLAEDGPVPILKGAVISEMTWAANEGRRRRGLAKPHHLDSNFNHELFWKRLKEVGPDLAGNLEAGRFPDWYLGAVEQVEKNRFIMVGLEDWQPNLRHGSGRKTLTWSKPETLTPRAEPEGPQLEM